MRNAEARAAAGFGGEAGQHAKRQFTGSPKAASSAAPESMRAYRVGLFANDLGLALNALTGDELKAFLRLRLEYLFAGCTGIVDNDAEIARRIGFRRWPALRSKLIGLGMLRDADGLLRDDDLEKSVQMQRSARERSRNAAVVRWSARAIGGGE